MTITTAGIAVPFLVGKYNAYVMDGTLVRRAVCEPYQQPSWRVCQIRVVRGSHNGSASSGHMGQLCENRERTNVPLLVLPHYSSEKGSARADIQGRNRCGDDKCLNENWWHER
jgi:hypothetical protein